MKNRLKELRNSLGLNQEKFGERIGVARNTITSYELGHRNLTQQTITAICKEFNVNDEWLKEGKGSMFLDLSQDEELAGAIGSIIAGENAFIKNTILSLSKLTEEEWLVIQKLVNGINEGMIKVREDEKGQ